MCFGGLLSCNIINYSCVVTTSYGLRSVYGRAVVYTASSEERFPSKKFPDKKYYQGMHYH